MSTPSAPPPSRPAASPSAAATPARPPTPQEGSGVVVDLAIIGAGAGVAALGPEWAGKRVVVIDPGPFGGTHVNTGGLPHAMLAQVADQARQVGRNGELGVGSVLYSVDWPKIQGRVVAASQRLSSQGEAAINGAASQTVLVGKARFISPREIRVQMADSRSVIINARHVLIATGSHPVLPLAVARSGVKVATSETLLQMPSLPERLIIVGGGAVAAQSAHIFSSLGVPVTVLVRGEAMLSKLDPSISVPFNQLASATWDVRYETEIVGVTATPEGVLNLRLSKGEPLIGTTVLAATGRRSSTGELDLTSAGVPIHSDGRILTDQFGQTAAPGVWAIGDAASPYQLQHVAEAEARMVSHNMLNPTDMVALPHGYVPRVINTVAPLATVGMTTQAAQEAGYDVVGFTQPFAETAWGAGVPDEHAACTVIADRATEQILGAHIIGPGAPALLQPLLQAMEWGVRVGDAARGQYWPAPGPADVVQQALLGVDARLT